MRGAATTAVLVAALAVSGCGGHDAEQADRPAAATAVAVRWVAPTGDDASRCERSSPCKTLDHALSLSSAGGEIRLLAGDYPAQALTGGPRGRRPVVLRPAPGARVRLGVLEFHTHGVELRDLELAGWHAYDDSGELTFRDARARWFFVDSASNIKILGGSVGPADSVDPQIRAANTTGAPVPRNILIDGVTFHDFTARQDPSQHIECLQFGAGDHVVVRRSRFLGCRGHGIFVASWGGTAKVRDFVFEDNHFGTVPDGYYSLRVAKGDPGAVSDITVRRNSALLVMQVDPGIPGVSFEQNLAPRLGWECFAGQVYRDNVWTQVKCGPTDRTIGAAQLEAAAADLHRRAGVAALGQAG